jgi:hypothetical protein
MLKANGVAEPTAKQVRDLYGGGSRNGKSVALVGEGTPMRWKIIRQESFNAELLVILVIFDEVGDLGPIFLDFLD